jgi:ABC-type sugar transport system ATPase subunit
MFIVGPAGAGKSTLARLVAGLDPLDDGEIYFDEKLMQGVPAGRRRVALIPRDGTLWPGLTVAENVGLPLKARKVPKSARRERVREILNLFRIETLAGRTPDRISPSQSLRVAMARALIEPPELLIFDEPLAWLDPAGLEDFRGALRALRSIASVTTLVMTREIQGSLSLADRIAVMDLGRIVQVGSPHELYNRPLDVFVARFLGPVNLLQGQVDGIGPGSRSEVVVRTPVGRLVGWTGGSGSLAPGAPVTIAIRPEALVLGGMIPSDSNRFPATIERLSFQGELRQVALRGPSDWPVHAVALQSQSRHLREGQSLTLSVSPEYVVILPGAFTTAPPVAGSEALARPD